MNTRFYRLLAAVLLVGTVAAAPFGLDKLTKAIDTMKDAGKVVKGAAGIGPDEESMIGASVAIELIGKYGGLVREDEITQRVNLVGGTLVRYSDRPDRHWRFGVLASDSINAFSAPDGYVFITRGLYDLATDDELLAGILGHEIAHITGRHALKIIERDEAFSGGKNLLLAHSADARQAQSTVDQINSQLGPLGLRTDKILKTLVESGYDSQTEFAADKTGHDLAAQTGYAPGGLRATLVILQTRKGEAQKPFPSHPPLKERIKRLPDEPLPKS